MRAITKARLVLVAGMLVLAAGALAACGDDSESAPAGTQAAAATVPPDTEMTLVLDFVPGAVHAGIYRAQAQGYYADRGIDLRIVEPTSTSDTLKLIDAGRADVGIAEGIELASLIAGGSDVRAILALTERPLGALITLADSGIDSPRDFAGKTLGVGGGPFDEAIVSTIVEGDGGDFGDVKTIVIGFNGVQALEAGRVDGFGGFGPSDGVQVEADGFPARVFPADEYGVPPYPGLVFFTSNEQIDAEPAALQAFVDATVEGYEDLLDDPQAALDDLLAQNEVIDPAIASAQMDAFLPMFVGDQERFGVLDDAVLTAFAGWLSESGIVKQATTPEDYATSAFVDASGGGAGDGDGG